MKFLHTFTKCGFLMAVLLLLSNAAFAQRTVKGKVTDAESSEGLIGATVTVVGTTRGASTDIDGNYSVEVPEGSTQLRIAYTGYTEQVIDLGASNDVEVAMKPGTVLDEVVVVGYGTIKAKEVTSAVASLKREDFNGGNITSAAQLIQGKVAGVSIGRPGSDPNGEFTIRLRGLSSLSAGQSPLVVLDGVPGVSLSLVDPNDIQSIDVLKDGSAAAIYGTRASAGVILVTTKKGTAGRTTADYNGFVALDQVANRYNTLNAARFVELGGDDLSPNSNADTDWFDEITQTGISQVHNLGLSGGMGNGAYRVSFNFRDVDGILRTTGFKQYNAGLNFNQKMLNNRLTINGNLALTTKDADYSFLEAFRYAVISNPTAEIRSSDAEFTRYNGYVEKDLFDYLNPVAMIEQNFNRGKVNRLLGNAHADFEIVSGLVAGLTLAQERKTETFSEFYSKQSKFRGAERNGFGSQGTANDIINTLELTGNYTRKFGNNSDFKLLGGYSFQQFNYEGLGIAAGNIISNEFTNASLGSFQDVSRGLAGVNSYKNESRLIAFFGRASFNIDDKFFASAGLRREGSTRFGPNNKWGLFPFFSAGVDITKFAEVGGVDQLKLRAGYGVTGNQPGQNSLYRRTYEPGARFFYNGNYVPSYGPVRNANPDLKWEEKGEFNVGLDYAFAGYKLQGSLDFYNRNTKDLILALTVPVPPNLSSRTIANVATISSTGFEATVNANNLIDGENFKYTPGLVFTTYTVKLKDFSAANDTTAYANVGSPGQNGINYTLLYNGAPLGQLWGPVRTGVTSDGKLTYEDIYGDGLTGTIGEINGYDQDQRKIGNGVPKFELGLNNSFAMGRFDLNFFLRGVFGHDLANEYRVFYEGLDPTAKTWNKVDTKFFNPNVTAPNRFDNTHVEKATFVRLDNATLGYNFGLPSSSWFTKARVYVSGQNLFTITNYTGVDPEARVGDPGDGGNRSRESTNFDPLAPGIDRRNTYFLARTVSFGVNFGF